MLLKPTDLINSVFISNLWCNFPSYFYYILMIIMIFILFSLSFEICSPSLIWTSFWDLSGTFTSWPSSHCCWGQLSLTGRGSTRTCLSPGLPGHGQHHHSRRDRPSSNHHSDPRRPALTSDKQGNRLPKTLAFDLGLWISGHLLEEAQGSIEFLKLLRIWCLYFQG